AEKGLEIASLVRQNIPNILIGDDLRFRQILLNLVGNAVKFTDAGSIIVEAVLERIEDGEAALRIEVSDTGIGIDTAVQSKLFEKFVQADSSVTRAFSGTGLGLAICKNLMEEMGGDLRVQSEVGVGSTFTVSIRLPAAEAPFSEEPARAPIDLTGQQILIVDDLEINRRALTYYVSAAGGLPTAVSSGAEALALLQSQTFDSAIVDYAMPQMSGLELRKAIEASEIKARPLIAIATETGVLGRESVARGLGFDATLQKPVRYSAFLKCMETLSTVHRNGSRTS
ncbi:MAG: ATP-binding protein, partial [Alphaproteobacteria bacterium]